MDIGWWLEADIVAYFYVGGMRDQQFLLPVSMRDWLDEGHLAWFVIDVVERIDTSALHAKHPNDGVGRPAYDPDMMLALIFYAYAGGVRSSRRIEASCNTDAAYRVICGDVVPDHATIARFLVDHQNAITQIFVQVLRLCAAAGLVSVGTIAIDGTKLGSDAALDANHREAWIRTQIEAILTEAREADAAEDAHPTLLGANELPVELSTATGRLARLEAALAVIEAQEAAAASAAAERAAKAQAAAAEGRKLRGRKPKDPHAALARAEADEQAVRVKAEAKHRTTTVDAAALAGAVEADPDVARAAEATSAARAAAQAATSTTKANTSYTQELWMRG